MIRKPVLCLFLFCIIGCSGCLNISYKTTQTEIENKKSETIGKIAGEQNNKTGTQTDKKDEDESADSKTEGMKKIVVLTYGDKMMTGMAQTICDSVGAVHYAISQEETERIKTSVNEAEYILIGTSKGVPELEFTLRNTLEKEELSGKKTALFLLNQEEEAEVFETEFTAWYPKAVMLPTFTMQSYSNLYDELGRMNGWLTTVLTYNAAEDKE